VTGRVPGEPSWPRRLAAHARWLAVDVRPLRHPAYRRLWLGQGVSFTGFQLTSVAVAVQVYTLTHSSFWVGLLGPANLVPLIAFGLWGGAIADAVDRRRLLIGGSLITWAATLALLVQAALGAGNVWLIIGLVAVQAVGFAITAPTRGAIIPRLLPVVEVPAANTLNFTFSQFATLAGPLAAAPLIGHSGFAAVYALDALLFTVGLYAAVRLPALPPLPAAGTEGPETGAAGTGPTAPAGIATTGAGAGGGAGAGAGAGPVTPGLRAVGAGLRYVWTQPVLLMSFVVDVIAMGVAMPRALFPEVADTRFGTAAVGWLFASIGIGALAGGLVSGWIGRIRRQGAALVIAIVIWGLGVAAAGLAPSLWLAVLLLAVAGAADLVSGVFRQTILQTYAPDEMRGRLQGVFIVVVAGGPRLGDLRAGGTAALVGATASWVGGGLACAAMVAAVGLLVPSLRRYTAPTGR
jgi:MFS family permease